MQACANCDQTLGAIIQAPLDSFLAFCALGIAYPQDAPAAAAISPFRFQRENSRFCDPIIAETQGMEWYVANTHFCEHSEAAQELFKAQLSTPAKHVTGMGSVMSHKELCARWTSSENEKSVHIETENGGYVIGVDVERGKDRGYFVGISKKEGKGRDNENDKEKENEENEKEEKKEEEKEEDKEAKGKWNEKLKWKGDKGKERGKWKWKWKGSA